MVHESLPVETGRWRLFGHALDPFRVTVASGMVLLAGTAWLASYVLGGTTGPMTEMDATMASAFLGVWVVGMVAMMFPVMIPTVLLFDRLLKTPSPGETETKDVSSWTRRFGTPTFLSGYLVMYAILGVAAIVALFFAGYLMMAYPDLMMWGLYVPPAVLLATGIYQLSPLKTRCLTAVHSPWALFSGVRRKNLLGSLRLGTRFGAYCVGCCWMYMAVMLVVGAMGLFWMGGLALVLSVEKSSGRWGKRFSQVLSVGFLIIGLALLVQTVGWI